MKDYSKFKTYPVKWEEFNDKAKEAFMRECIVPKMWNVEGMPVLKNGYPYYKAKPFSEIESSKELKKCQAWHDWAKQEYLAKPKKQCRIVKWINWLLHP